MKTMRVVGMMSLCLALLLASTSCGKSDESTDTTAPTTPTNLTCTSLCNDSTPTFTWDAATDDDSGVDYYQTSITLDAGGVGGIWANIGNVTTYTCSSALSEGSHTFWVAAVDKAGNAATAASLVFTCDTSSPIISSVTASSFSEIGCTIAWTTNEYTTCHVEYGTTTAYGSSQPASVNFLSSYAYSYIINLTGLTANTTYHFRVKSKDACGNESTSIDASLATLPDTSPPVISAVNYSGVSRMAATVTWNTDEPATSEVEYGTTTAYGSLSAPDSILVSTHSVTIALNSYTTWHFRVRSRDAAGNESVSADVRFTTSKVVFEDWAENVIWIMNPDGSSQTQLTQHGNNDADPALSHDGTRIAFESNRTGTWEIYLMNEDGTSVTHLVEGTDPAWSWDDTKIAFSQSGMLCLINPDGTGFEQLTGGTSPCFSPDDQEIVFVTGFWNIFKIDLDTLAVTQLTDVSSAGSPAWSPDGSTIIYADSSVGLQYTRLWAMNSDGTNKRALTAPDWGAETAWSPDGTRILYGMMLMNSDGTNAVEIPTTAFMPGNPSWA